MFIEFDSTIRILSGVPLSSDYKNTIYFSSVSNQTTYFSSKTKYVLTKQSYARHTKGVVRVEVKSDNLYDCNYLMFQNTSFGSKWFYAFIDSVEYVNNNTAEIRYTIDELQSWYFELELLPSFVEREHSSTDEIGDSITEENIQCGEMVYENHEKFSGLDRLCTVVAYAEEDFTISGKLQNGIYSGLTLVAFNTYNTTDGLNLFLTSKQNKPESVVAIYTMPMLLFGGVPSENGSQMISSTSGVKLKFNLPSVGSSFGGYTPKNKKLFTYPFNYCLIDNGSANSMPLRFEFFGNGGELEVVGSTTQPVRLMCRPKNYKGVGRLNVENLTLDNYPTCGWVSDSYAAWLAQNSVTTMTDSIMPMVVGLGTGAVTGGVGPALTVGSILAKGFQASMKADVARGNANSGSINANYNDQSFYRCRARVTEEYAKIVDDYFSKYGYNCSKVKIPNTNVRTNWTYVKTVNCNASGDLPNTSINKIKNIFDNGITFWVNGNNVGRYDLDNNVK